MKRILACMLIAVLLLTASCAAVGAESYQKYRYTFFGCFDTVVIFTAYTRDQAEFQTYAGLVESEMLRYHRIFDKYNAYEGVNNLYLVNQSAGKAPVAAEPELMDLLVTVRGWRERYGGAQGHPGGGPYRGHQSRHAPRQHPASPHQVGQAL